MNYNPLLQPHKNYLRPMPNYKGENYKVYKRKHRIFSGLRKMFLVQHSKEKHAK